MTYLVKLSILTLTAIIVTGNVVAIELPSPADLSARHDLRSRNVAVIEPHESTNKQTVIVNYKAFPLPPLLTNLFGESWKADDAEIVFLARDGYRSVTSSAKLNKFRSYLAYARKDGAPFIVNNIGQNEKQVPLGPYYLIWQNKGFPELLRQGAYGWPYQITAIELHNKNEDRALLPRSLSAKIEQGFTDTKEYCLTCHNIRGIGGKKYPVDLVKTACRLTDIDLKAWIETPSRYKPDTTMPPLAPKLPAKERRQIIENIVGYLKAMESEQADFCD